MGKLRSKNLAVLIVFHFKSRSHFGVFSAFSGTSRRKQYKFNNLDSWFGYVVDWSFSSSITQLCTVAQLCCLIKTTSFETRELLWLPAFTSSTLCLVKSGLKCFLPHKKFSFALEVVRYRGLIISIIREGWQKGKVWKTVAQEDSNLFKLLSLWLSPRSALAWSGKSKGNMGVFYHWNEILAVDFGDSIPNRTS